MLDNTILDVKGLTKKYNSFELKGVDFNIPRGYIMGFIGRNGAGKSTTLKCIMNLINFDAGSVSVFGLDNRMHSLEIRNRIGYVSEDQYFYDDVSVEWMANFVGGFYKTWDQKKLDQLLKKFDINKKKKVKELSKGMKMKLSLALALAHRPEFLIMDEPTSGLDPIIRSELLEMLMDIIQDEQCSILFSSHITTDIEKIADFVTVIDNGRILLSEEKHGILNSWKLIKAQNDYFDSAVAERLKGVKKGEFGFSGLTNDLNTFNSAFRRLYPQGSYKTERVNLEELLVRFVREGELNA